MAVGYGFRYIDEYQVLEDDGVIYPTGIFGYACAMNEEKKIAYHQSLNSWVAKSKEEQRRDNLDRYYLLGIYDFYKKQRRRIVRIVKTIMNVK